MGLQQKLERAFQRRIALIQKVTAEPRADLLIEHFASLALSRRAKLGVVVACYGAALKAVDDARPLGDPVKTCVRAVGMTLAERTKDPSFDPGDVKQLKLTEECLKAVARLGWKDIGRIPSPEPQLLSRADAELACARHLLAVAEGNPAHARSAVATAARAIAWPSVSTEDVLLALGREFQPVLTHGGLSVLISDLMWLKLEGHGPKAVLAMVEQSLHH